MLDINYKGGPNRLAHRRNQHSKCPAHPDWRLYADAPTHSDWKPGTGGKGGFWTDEDSDLFTGINLNSNPRHTNRTPWANHGPSLP